MKTVWHQTPNFDWSKFEFVSEIRAHLEDFTRRQRRVAEYILQQPESIAFLSITELSKKADTSEATIVRFCNSLGYEGYSQFSSKVRNNIQHQFGSVDRFNLGQLLDSYISERKGDDSIFSRVIGQEIENLFNLTRSIRASEFHACVDRVLESDQILVIGAHASSALVMHMHQMLSKVVAKVFSVTHHAITTSTLIRHLTAKSTVFLITFPLYAKFSLEVAAAAKDHGAQIVVLTDSHLSPAVELADRVFFIPVDVPSFVDAYAAPIAFINALATEIGVRSPECARHALDNYDQIVSRWKLFCKKPNEWKTMDDRLSVSGKAKRTKTKRESK
jgi:DNA-binding MurR/RpiR family transcriptional regulator